MSSSQLNLPETDDAGPPPFEAEAFSAAEQHLAELHKHHPARPAEGRPGSGPTRLQLGRRFERERERISIRFEGWRLAWEAPYHPLGWLVAQSRLLRRPTLGPSTILAILIAALVVVVTEVSLPFVGDAGSTTVGALFLGGAVTGLIVAVWGDLVRLPYNSWRIRRRIIGSPWDVLPTTARKREAELMARDDTIRIMPRRELYDELLPGILDRSQRDTQLVVGEPGSGKTTALVGLSQLLARLGIVPVVVPLWGKMPENLVDMAKQRFMQHSRGLVRSEELLSALWQWLQTHRRLVILVDDLDRIAPDGDRGFLLRKALGELAGECLPAVVTTRPAGIPAGLAASAINLDSFDEGAAARHVIGVAREQPGTSRKVFDAPEVRGNVDLWIREGRLAEVPFYLELLARLVAANRCEELAPASSMVHDGKPGRVRRRADGVCEWDPLWVRFRLFERFYDGVAEGTVHRWLGIDVRERASCLEALSEAALSQLAATALEALSKTEDGKSLGQIRVAIEEFLDADDRSSVGPDGRRKTVSAHEVVSTAERLRMLDRDPDGKLHFNHRLLQAYLAGRCLAERMDEREVGQWPLDCPLDWIGALLDSRHPERMTANMTLVFAALRESERERRDGKSDSGDAARRNIELIQERLIQGAKSKLTKDDEKLTKDDEDEKALGLAAEARVDPRCAFDPEQGRTDPDDALAKLTTAAEIATATDHLGQVPSILDVVKDAAGATRWTKLNAIPAIAALREENKKKGRKKGRKESSGHWTRIWEFARDPDQEVKRMASDAIAEDAFHAFRALECGVTTLIARAALKSARDLPIDIPVEGAGWLDGGAGSEALAAYGIENERDEVLSLKALGWVLPAVVSGLREHPARQADHGSSSHRDDHRGRASGAQVYGHVPDGDEYDDALRDASRALDRLVALAFQMRFPELEASVAQGFKNDAMRHADDSNHRSGPGLVESNRQLVSDICLDNARHWYARMVLHQALALYTVAGSDPRIAFDAYERACSDSGGEPHPLVSVAAGQARRVVVRHTIRNPRWRAFVWADEGDAASRRQASLNRTAAQLVADVTLLLNLNERAPEDRGRQFAHMNRLPYCLHESKDRLEILGAGCPDVCAYHFCPLREAPVDEPDGQRTISRAFCRGQQRIAAHERPPWHKRIGKKDLKRFWKEMETRART
ncbi:MAG TPA: ATP-binding protein [Solirubrobacterales bacterium]|nr:ATP-binding protein [Solirubrobacterales bacterium]